MKKIKLDGKLSLNKETIAKLNDEQMYGVKGGDGENEALTGSKFLCGSSRAGGNLCICGHSVRNNCPNG